MAIRRRQFMTRNFAETLLMNFFLKTPFVPLLTIHSMNNATFFHHLELKSAYSEDCYWKVEPLLEMHYSFIHGERRFHPSRPITTIIVPPLITMNSLPNWTQPSSVTLTYNDYSFIEPRQFKPVTAPLPSQRNVSKHLPCTHTT